jgi:hypothetical protein
MLAGIFSLIFVATSVTRARLAHRRGVAGDGRLTGRVRFLRAGLVILLPGGPGIDSSGITTGARGAPLRAPVMVRVTPAPARRRETRPGLSRGINLRGQNRGGAPKGERACAKPAAAPEALSGGNACECGAAKGRLRLSALRLPSFCSGGRNFRAVRRKARMQTHRENGVLLACSTYAFVIAGLRPGNPCGDARTPSVPAWTPARRRW